LYPANAVSTSSVNTQSSYFRERAHKLADKIPHQIFFANSGAAIATLSFYGASLASTEPAKIALLPLTLFLIGICTSIGFLVATAIALRDIEHPDPANTNEKLSQASVLAIFFAIVGLGCFISGAAVGVLLLAFQ
jgi:hypothetical protein